MTRKRPTDPTVAGCLEEIRKGELTALGVLADYMSEQRLPHRARVRGWFAWYERRRAFWTDPTRNHSRRHLTAWENARIDREYVRQRIAAVFGRKWRVPRELARFVAPGVR